MTVASSVLLGWWQRDHANMLGPPELAWVGMMGAPVAVALLLSLGPRRFSALLGIRHPFTYPPTWLGIFAGVCVALILIAHVDALSETFEIDAAETAILGDATRFLVTVTLVALGVGLAISGIDCLAGILKRKRFARLCKQRASLSPSRSVLVRGATEVGLGDADAIRSWLRTDNPLLDGRDDILDHVRIARRMAARLVSSDASAQAVIGPLGVGKTSLRNLVGEKLRTEFGSRRVELINVELWPYENTRAAVEGLIRSVAHHLAAEVYVLRLRGLPGAYADVAEAAGGLLSGIARLGSRPASPFDALAIVDSIATAIGVRYVVWVEDLERFAGAGTGSAESPDEAERLTPLRAALFGLDRLASVTVVTATTSLLQRFDLEKIARFVEKLPALDKRICGRVIAVLRAWLLSDSAEDGSKLLIDPVHARYQEWKRWETISDDTHIPASFGGQFVTLADAVVSLCPTPRVLKQGLRRIEETWAREKGEIDLDDVIPLAILREASPKAFAILEEHVDALRSQGEGAESDRAADRAGTPLQMLGDALRAGEVPAEATAAVLFIAKHVFTVRLSPQGFAWRQPTDYWSRFLSLPDLEDHERDQSLIRLMRAGPQEIVKVLRDRGRSDKAEHFGSVVPKRDLVDALLALVEMSAEEDPGNWDAGTPPGLVPLWRLTRTQVQGMHEVSSADLFAVVMRAIESATQRNLVLVTMIEQLYASSAGVNALLDGDQRGAVRAKVTTLFRDGYAREPAKLADRLRNAPAPTLLWLCWGLERVQGRNTRGKPFDDWDQVRKTILEAVAIQPEPMLKQVACLVTDERVDGDSAVVDVTRPRRVTVDEEACVALFGNVETVFSLFRRFTVDASADQRVSAVRRVSMKTASAGEDGAIAKP